eukprot:TRINITY_DN3332_c0_g4_i1.p1 TRINITY_DN3332_c0_g4~~TRINITY_DN3332_c0_g4_i1.p1  ORF type:complete len:220 (+),score=27.84 TRINITY_DN3332_c0_g4_i1:204-863(+)
MTSQSMWWQAPCTTSLKAGLQTSMGSSRAMEVTGKVGSSMMRSSTNMRAVGRRRQPQAVEMDVPQPYNPIGHQASPAPFGCRPDWRPGLGSEWRPGAVPLPPVQQPQPDAEYLGDHTPGRSSSRPASCSKLVVSPSAREDDVSALRRENQHLRKRLLELGALAQGDRPPFGLRRSCSGSGMFTGASAGATLQNGLHSVIASGRFAGDRYSGSHGGYIGF